MAWHIAVVVASLVVLTIGASVLVRGASSLALRTGMSPLFVGLAVVGLGTSMPELSASLMAASDGLDGISVGNVVGSNIFNIAVILGVTAMIVPITVRSSTIRTECVIVLLVACVPFAAWLTGGVVTRWMGALLLVLFAVYLWRGFEMSRAEARRSDVATVAPVPSHVSWAVSVACIVGGVAALVIGSQWLVGASTQIAKHFGVSDLIIGLTVVAAGTSTPEAFTTVAAALRGEMDVAVGNVIGSNVFNVLGILGVTSLFQPQSVSTQTLWLDAPVMVLVSAALLPVVLTRARISRLEGALLVAGYVSYLAALIWCAPAWFGG